jgi:hypothetical protein
MPPMIVMKHATPVTRNRCCPRQATRRRRIRTPRREWFHALPLEADVWETQSIRAAASNYIERHVAPPVKRPALGGCRMVACCSIAPSGLSTLIKDHLAGGHPG